MVAQNLDAFRFQIPDSIYIVRGGINKLEMDKYTAFSFAIHESYPSQVK